MKKWEGEIKKVDVSLQGFAKLQRHSQPSLSVGGVLSHTEGSSKTPITFSMGEVGDEQK